MSATRLWSLALPVVIACLCLTVASLAVGYMIRSTPMVFVPRDGPPLMAVGRPDTIGGHLSCQVEYRLVRLNR